MNDEQPEPHSEDAGESSEPKNIAPTRPEEPQFPENQLQLSCNAKHWEGDEPLTNLLPKEKPEHEPFPTSESGSEAET